MHLRRLLVLAMVSDRPSAIALRAPPGEQWVGVEEIEAIALSHSLSGCDQFAVVPGNSHGCPGLDGAIAAIVEAAIDFGAC